MISRFPLLALDLRRYPVPYDQMPLFHVFPMLFPCGIATGLRRHGGGALFFVMGSVAFLPDLGCNETMVCIGAMVGCSILMGHRFDRFVEWNKPWQFCLLR